jgi:hypothetical protein
MSGRGANTAGLEPTAVNIAVVSRITVLAALGAGCIVLVLLGFARRNLPANG